MQRRNFLLNLAAAPLCTGLVNRLVAGQDSSAGQSAGAGEVDVEKYRAAAIERWGQAVAELERKDKIETHPDDSILFVGSSSIRRWDDIKADMAPYHPIQRGYGGAKWSDVAIFAERLISPHRFRAAVFYVGNDITGKPDDKSPAEVKDLFSYVVGKVRERNKEAPVFFVAVTPSPSRLGAWPKIREANSTLRQYCQAATHLHFVGTQSVFLDAAGKPRPELFVEDRLHLNREGYVRWAAAIKSQFDTILNGAG